MQVRSRASAPCLPSLARASPRPENFTPWTTFTPDPEWSSQAAENLALSLSPSAMGSSHVLLASQKAWPLVQRQLLSFLYLSVTFFWQKGVFCFSREVEWWWGLIRSSQVLLRISRSQTFVSHAHAHTCVRLRHDSREIQLDALVSISDALTHDPALNWSRAVSQTAGRNSSQNAWPTVIYRTIDLWFEIRDCTSDCRKNTLQIEWSELSCKVIPVAEIESKVCKWLKFAKALVQWAYPRRIISVHLSIFCLPFPLMDVWDDSPVYIY